MKLIKLKDPRKINGGNRTPRNDNQRNTARNRMIKDNPMKEPRNKIEQSQRMMGNQRWRFRKKHK